MNRLVLLLPLVIFSGCSPVAPIDTHHVQVKYSTNAGPLQIGIDGMTHGHVEGLLWRARARDDITIVGVCEPNQALFERLMAKHGLADVRRYDDLGRMLDECRPEAVSVMSSIKNHRFAVEACAPRGVHLLIEKPLAFDNADALRMAEVSRRHGVLILINYETSWYASLREAKRLVASEERGPLRRMVFRHGHKGPIEIGCAPEFVAWLTDPAENGGGALVDFGCYGAILATWLMDGQRPTHVTASAATLKPNMYPRVDDDATIVLTYPGATAVIQASWAWTHDNKEMDVHTERGSIHARKWNELEVRDPDRPANKVVPPELPASLQDEWTYLREVVRGRCAVDPLSSLELNLVAVEILDAARRSVGRATSAPLR